VSVRAGGTDEVARAAGLVAGLVERAALDGSTVVPVEVVAAALRAVGVPDPAPGAEQAGDAGRVVAYPDERLLGHPSWAAAEGSIAQDVVRLVAASGVQAVVVVDAPRGSAPRAVVGPLVDAVRSAGGRPVRVRGADGPADGTAVAGADLVVVERADLLGLGDAARLLASTRDGARLVLVGDPALPPAPGPGRVLADLTASGAVPVLPAPGADDEGEPLAVLVRGLRDGALPVPNPGRRDVVVTPAEDGALAVRRAVQLVTSSVPRVFGVPAADTVVVAPRADGVTGTTALRTALRTALAAAGAAEVPVLAATEAVGRRAGAVVLVLGAEAAGSLARDLLVGAATEAGLHLSVVHQAGPALAEAVVRLPHRPRRTRLAGLLVDVLAT